MPYGNISRALNNEGNMSGTLTIQPTAGSGVSDVLVNSESVVTDHKAYVNIEVEQTVTEGKKIASVIVNGNNTDILIPETKIYDEASGDLITIDDAMEAPLEECKVTLEPQQDLHGYDSPWVGGSGKNKLQVTATTRTLGGVTFTVNDDGTVTLNGTASGWQAVYKNYGNVQLKANTEYILTSEGRSFQLLYVDLYNGTTKIASTDFQVSQTFSVEEDITATLDVVVYINKSVTNQTIKPMIRLATETDPTYAPYSNICPISGWDECKVQRTGVNLWDEEWESGSYRSADGTPSIDASRIRSKNKIEVISDNMYLVTLASTLFFFYDANDEYLGYKSQSTSGVITPITWYPDAKYIRFSVGSSSNPVTDYTSGIAINYPSKNTEYHTYNGQTYTIQLGSTCYGGELDVKSGVLKVTDGYIASYNGETLPSTWISDRDVYTPNTRPTTGAEVVYKLSAPQEIQLTPTEVTLLRGINNLWSDGEMYVKWRVDVEMLLQSIVDNR